MRPRPQMRIRCSLPRRRCLLSLAYMFIFAGCKRAWQQIAKASREFRRYTAHKLSQSLDVGTAFPSVNRPAIFICCVGETVRTNRGYQLCRSQKKRGVGFVPEGHCHQESLSKSGFNLQISAIVPYETHPVQSYDCGIWNPTALVRRQN